MGERMQWSEAEAVVRAYREERGATDVDIATLARALGTDVAEVRRLAGRRRRFVDGSGILSAALAGAVAAAAVLLAGPRLLNDNPLLASLRPAAPATAPAPGAPVEMVWVAPPHMREFSYRKPTEIRIHVVKPNPFEDDTEM